MGADGGGPAGVVEAKENAGLLEAGVVAPAGAAVGVAVPVPMPPKRLELGVWFGVVADGAAD